MAKGIFIIGTDTGVGKTVVSAGLLHMLISKGYNACYYKPVSSGAFVDKGQTVPYDARFVKTVCGLDEDYKIISPCSFVTPVSPHLASKMEGRAVDVPLIKKSFEYLKEKYAYIIAEGCGGLAVPLNDKGYMLYDLILELGFDCVIVARAGIGTINHTLLTVKFAENIGIKVRGIFINRYTGVDYEQDNIEMIKNLSGIPVIGILPAVQGVDIEGLNQGRLTEIFGSLVGIDCLLNSMCGV